MDYAVELVPTTRRRHITGTTALNIPGSYRLGGDWHEHSTWFSHREERINEADLTNEETHGRLLDLLGGWGLRDARKGLAKLGHPGGESPNKVWAASHDRAVVEAGWKQLIRWTECGLSHPPFDLMELERLLPHPDQWIRLHWWAWRLRHVMTPAELKLWDRWRKQWTPLGDTRERYPPTGLNEEERGREPLPRRLGRPDGTPRSHRNALTVIGPATGPRERT